MKAHECYHCKQWVEEGEAHDCWTTTEDALTRELPEDIRDAWERLREAAVEFGEQRIYASHHSIMFARRACYFFVRPRHKYLELCIFLGRPLKGPLVRNVMPSSRSKFANLVRVVHRDQVEPPLTDWIGEAYTFAGQPPAKPVGKAAAKPVRKTAVRKKPARKPIRKSSKRAPDKK